MKKRMDDSSRIIEVFVKAGLIAAIAAALLSPLTINANSHEAGSTSRSAHEPAVTGFSIEALHATLAIAFR